MAISMSRRKPRPAKKAEAKGIFFSDAFLFKVLARVPTAILLLILVFLWSSSFIVISGNIVHICVSSRKLNNLYCLSAGTQPNFQVPIPTTTNGSVSPVTNAISKETIEEIANAVSPSTISSNEEVFNVVNPSSNDSSIIEVINDTEEKLNPATTDVINIDKDEELANAKKIVEEQIQLHRSWVSSANPTQCDGRGIHVYDLPLKFNKDLIGQCGDMIPWTDFCKYFENEAMGQPIAQLGRGWYHTHQYSLEPIFHARMLKHPCRVENEADAKLFYVPYYGGLDVLRWHFKNVSTDVKDSLALDLIKWLTSKKTWTQNSGKDHVFVLGKISWDFRRRVDNSWGTRFLTLEQMQNPIKLLIERHPWEINDIGIPHPTCFHPHSDEDIVSWQQKIIQATRKSLVSFAGAARPDQPENIRSILINQCSSTPRDICQFLNCSSGGCDQPESIIELFQDSEFCFQPPGDSPTRKSVFDSLVSGCIPVLFDPFTAYYQYPWHLPEEHGKYSVFIDQEEVRQMKVNVVERLMAVPATERDEMRRYIVYELLPKLVYGDSSAQFWKFQDAFLITVNNLLERVNKL